MKIATDNVKIAQRAYLSVRNGRYTLGRSDVGGAWTEYAPTVSFEIVNSGNTPASITALLMSHNLRYGDGYSTGTWGRLGLIVEKMEVDAHSSVSVRTEVPGSAHMGDFHSSEPPSGATWGVLQYQDVFHEEHSAEWCWLPGDPYAHSIDCDSSNPVVKGLHRPVE